MRIYVADLAEYNAGKLIGQWFDLDDYTDGDDLQADITAMLKARGNEEWAIHDYDEAPSGLGEHECLHRLVALNNAINEHGEAFSAFWGNDSYNSVDSAVEWFEESYCGDFNSLEDYAEQLFDELYLDSVPENIRSYIDYEAFARDLGCEGYWISGDGHVFRPY